MDPALVATIWKNLESKTTEELRRICEGDGNANKSREELEAARQLLEERQAKGYRAASAIACAIVVGGLAATGAWWQGASEVFVILAGLGGAALGFASLYVPNLIPRT